MNGADSRVETLTGAGVEVCFANPGTSEMDFVAALDRVGLARGMGVEAARSETLEELERHFAAGVRSEGPYLIDLVL